MSTAPPIRQEMVSSAISFLSDPKVQSSSLGQRVAFLESKGLNTSEIEEALRQSGMTSAVQSGPHHVQQQIYHPQQHPSALYPHPPPQNGRDWRDWFIMAVISGAVGYGVISLARKYLFPHLQPPNQTILESDRDALTAKYDEVAATLAQLDAETRAVKVGLEQQKAAVDGELKQVEEALQEVRAGERTRREEMDKIAREVADMKRDMPKMFESTSAASAASLTELQTELKSLRSLLASRASLGSNASGVGAGGSSSLRPGFASPRTGNASPPPFGVGQANGKPAIPAWQLAASGGSGAASPTAVPDKNGADGPMGTSAAEAGKDHAKEESGATEV